MYSFLRFRSHGSSPRFFARTFALIAAFAVTAFAIPHHAHGQFAATSLNPANQTVTAGDTFTVDVVFATSSSQTYGIQFWMGFDPSILQAVSITTGAASPFTDVFADGIDNTNGKLTYGATGSTVVNTSVIPATIEFEAIADGTSQVNFSNVNQYIAGFGPFGVNGLATGGSVTVEGGAELLFEDPLTGPDSPNLDIDFDKYGYTADGLERIQSDNATDRPMVKTASCEYLTATDFTAELTVWLANNDLLFFGLGQGFADPGFFNEPSHAFYFRIHRNFQGSFVMQAAVRATTGVFEAVNTLGTYSAGSAVTLRIKRSGDDITMSIDGHGSATFSLSQHNAALGLTNDNTKIFFGNTTAGSMFSLLSITEGGDDTPPVINVPDDITVEATGPDGAVVTFTATAEDDVDGPVTVIADPESGSLFPLGTTVVDLGAVDAAGNQAFETFNVTVVDTTSPEIESVTPSTGILWPANHKMVEVSLDVVASDAVGVTSLKIVDVTSSEPDNGRGDGNTTGDIEITGDLTVKLRAERNGRGDGRTYIITVEAMDAAGNTSYESTTVFVPKSMGRGR